jgi:uncharacterized C2H2 Zn-finger protein
MNFFVVQILSAPNSPAAYAAAPRSAAAPGAEFTAFGRRRWFTCDICLRVFNRKFLLTQHALAAHAAQSALLRCGEQGCAYVCRSRTTLSKHAAKQHAPKTLRCPHCPDTFSMHWSLNEHLNHSHTYYRYFYFSSNNLKKIALRLKFLEIKPKASKIFVFIEFCT